MFKLVLEKAEEPEIKLPTSAGSWKKQESKCFPGLGSYFILIKRNISSKGRNSLCWVPPYPMGAGREGIRVNQVVQWSQAQKKGLCFAFWNMMLLMVAWVELRSALCPL